MISRPIAVEPREDYKIWLRYADGVEGVVDLSDIPRCGIFEVWNDESLFKKVYISEFDAIAWTEDVELCPDSLYIKVTGKSAEELMPSLTKLSPIA